LKVLVLGSGAKDHAIAWMFSKSRRITGLYIAPGNAGTETIGINLPDIDPADTQAVLQFCRNNDIHLVFVGTEAPLAAGVTDALREAGFAVFGAPKKSVKLESDKSYARHFMNSYHIPTSQYAIIQSYSELDRYLRKHEGMRFVIKPNGLAPSRIMVDSDSYEKLSAFGRQQLEHGPIILEEHLKGYPLTLTVLTDGKGYLMLPNCSEYTKAEENDRGAPTGGMGSICPVPFLNRASSRHILETIVEPTLEGMRKENLSYQGVLIFSMIMNDDGAKVVDYHVRFNDPATQSLLPLISSDFIDITEAVHEERIADFMLEISPQSAVAVVVASKGYPGKPEMERTVRHIPCLINSSHLLFHGAAKNTGKKLVTNGGRCFTAVGLGTNIIEANERAYAVVSEIDFDGLWYRSDIGSKFFQE